MWTEITKDLCCREALMECGYEFEETEYFFYVMQYLKYVSCPPRPFIFPSARWHLRPRSGQRPRAHPDHRVDPSPPPRPRLPQAVGARVPRPALLRPPAGQVRRARLGARVPVRQHTHAAGVRDTEQHQHTPPHVQHHLSLVIRPGSKPAPVWIPPQGGIVWKQKRGRGGAGG